MRTASPWWASLVFGLGLLLLFLGERIFGHVAGLPHLATTGLGLVLVLGVTAVRGWTTMATSGARRRVERTLLVCHLGVLVGLALYLFTTTWGVSHLHLSESGAAKADTILTVLWSIVVLGSLVPMFMIEMSLGLALRTSFDIGGGGDDEGIEYYRVREIGWSGLSVALATAFLMVTCNVATQRNIQRDVSYFKTAAPGESTKNIVAASQDPIKVLLFFPAANEVQEQVKGYFTALAAASGHLVIETHDRMVDAEVAGKYKVTKDGVIVIVRGTGDKEKSQTIEVDTDIDKARKGASKLRNFDREVNTILMKLVRDKRKAYLTAGHGEVTDPDSIPPDMKGKVPERRTTTFKKRIGELNYEVKDLGLIDLSKDVPEDATVVIMIAPTMPLQPAEWAALGRYLDKGGRLLIALDPKGNSDLGDLSGRLGLTYAPGDLTDDQNFMPQRGNISDRRVAITTQFSAHASTTSLSRAARGLVLLDAGAFVDAPFTVKGETPKKTITIRSMESSWLDLTPPGGQENFTFDAASEKRQRWNVAAAVEGPKLKGPDGKDRDGWRVLAYADADIFADALVQNSLGRAQVAMVGEIGGGAIVDDAIRWLGGEEVFSGEVVSEDDKPINHTKSQDAVWFTLTLIGAPLLVLTLGLVGTWARRRRGKKAVEVKS